MTDQPNTEPAPPKTIAMTAITDGSIHGFPFQAGNTLEVDEADVESLQRMGLAVRKDAAELAQQAREAAAKAAADREAAGRRNPVVS